MLLTLPTQQFKLILPVRHAKGFDYPSLNYLTMYERWEPGLYLWGGTPRMRLAEKKYLPQEPRESNEAYQVRLERTYLFNGYKRAVKHLASQPFTKPVSVSGLPPELQYIEDDADSQGNSLTDVAYQLLEIGLQRGLYHVLVDYPLVDGELTVADARRMNIRPYFNVVDPIHLLGWKHHRHGGVNILDEIRMREIEVEETGDGFEETFVTRIRIYRPNEVENHVRYGSSPGEDFKEESLGENTLGEIPLITGYTERTGFLTGAPPLEDLIWLNIRHWQSSSDQNNILHVARVPFILGTGFNENELDDIEIGAQRAIISTNSEADMKYVEHTAQAVGAGEKDLQKTEAQMQRMGADILYQKSVARQTATGRQMDKADSLSIMQVIIRDLEHTLERSIQKAGRWLNISERRLEEIKVSVGEDLSLAGAESDPIDKFEMWFDKGRIDIEDYNKEMKRRGIISPNVFLREPIRAVKQQAEESEQEPEEAENEEETELF